MKIACYCQHVLGIGHFHRSLSICEELSRRHETVMILGGPDVPLPKTDVRFFSLPGLRMDETFSNLLPCRKGADVQQIKEQRQQELFTFLQEFQPDVFLVELYPFGRKAFRFELDPVLQAMKSGALPPCLRLCSLRDILVEKKKKETYEKRVLTTLNTLFDGLLIHSDPHFIPLEQTYSRLHEIDIPLHYTGFISRPTREGSTDTIRRQLQLRAADKLIVGSIGGGSVGAELLHAVVDTSCVLNDQRLHFHLFCGPYSDPGLKGALQQRGGINVTVHPFSRDFPEWLQAANLSISMAGYNTCMNILAAAIPALLYPFARNREQKMRIDALGRSAPLIALSQTDLNPDNLARQIQKMLQLTRQSSSINLDGARETAVLLESLQKQQEKRP